MNDIQSKSHTLKAVIKKQMKLIIFNKKSDLTKEITFQ